MKTLTISGRMGCGKSTLAERRYNELCRAGHSVALIDTDSYGDYYSDERARTQPDVRIVTKIEESDLRETQE